MPDLQQKIKDLFLYRKFPFLMEMAGQNYKNHPLIEQLIKLQEAIYYLDHHLETHWDIKAIDLKPFWDDIFKALKNIGLNKEEQLDYVKHLEKYQKHELYMREGKWPNRFNLNYFYFYKSCDVKMLRRIIYKFYPSLQKTFTLADWRYFDLITEVNDDIEDIFEDQETINGNSLLINLHTIGIQSTKKMFQGFIKEIEIKNEERLKTKPSYKKIFDWTQNETRATQKLLVKNLKSVQEKELDSKIKQYLLVTT